MRIALVVPGGVDRSGEARVIPALVALLGRLAAEHDVHVFATHQETAPGFWTLEGAKIHNLGAPRTAWRAAMAVLAEHRRQPFQVIHAFWSGRHGALAVGLGTLLGVPSVVHVAGGELAALADIGYGGCLTWRGRARERAVLRRATIVTCASRPIMDLVAAHGVAARRVPLGADTRLWPLRRPARRRPADRARLVHVASLNAVKDQATLLHAMRRLEDEGRDFGLDVVGEDTLGGRIQALAERQGLGARVRFHGFLTQRALRPIVEAAHVAVVSSRHEAGPLVLLEAALAGVPTVGTAVGHLAEWSPRAALAVPCRDAAALAAALGSVLDDEDLRIRLADEAQRRASLEHVDHTARTYDDIYRSLAGSKQWQRRPSPS
jgi:glycosyltransferase involved in cell wall biosynthesis